MNLLNSLPIQVLCLDKRQELWSELIPQLSFLSYSVHPFYVGDGDILPPEQYNKINWSREHMGAWGYGQTDYFKWRHWNASISHRMMIKRAKDNGWKRFLLLEDDVYITDRFNHVWCSLNAFYTEEIKNMDLFYLGWWIGDENDEWNKSIEQNYFNGKSYEVGIKRATQIGGLHAVIINESMYDTILNFPWNNPIDMQLNGIHDKIQSYYVCPKIIHVKSVYSHCEGAIFNRNII